MFIDDDNHDSERQQAIQEILNNAMGNAAESLASVIDSPVKTSVPKTHWVNNNNLQATLSGLNLPDRYIVMRQSFRGHLRGEIIILLEHGAKHYQLGKVMGYEDKMTSLNIQELTLELANVLSGACISGLSNQLNINLSFHSPSLLSEQASVGDILSSKGLHWTDALFMDVGYTVSSISMKTHVILCMTESDSHELYRIIDIQLGQS
jgi:chemotaxis protein CheC